MKSKFFLPAKYKAAIVLLLMITMLLGGILLERHFFQKINSASTALFEDRLMPSTFVYHLTDFIHQRHRVVEKTILIPSSKPTAPTIDEISTYRQQMDSIMVAFQSTFLVKEEMMSLERLKTALKTYENVEQQLLSTPATDKNIKDLEFHLDAIRTELFMLSNIQTTVGKELLTDSDHVVATAYALNKFQISILIICCLIAQVFILRSKIVRSPIPQQPNLN
ncbi:MCP four helix bundle domain-containing protein [Lewinella sp. LCG006]|uniref:MCP four helix bundle domain-containing protein n=1 Tax=Lewinella sp. LCG006 TaxID=3231911 RepID=UPI00345F5ABA